MGSVNATRNGMARSVTDATEHARLIGFNDDGLACVWAGGYTFTVYDAARGWSEVRSFTSGKMIGSFDEESAREHMKIEGFDPV